MIEPSDDGPELRRWHRLLEHYTPGGALGRLLLAAATATVSVSGVALGIAGFTSIGLFAFLVGIAATGVGLAAGVLTVVTLWPVYLSLIGNVDSASAYPEGNSGPPSAERDDPEAVLKRQYAEGKMSREEFERRLDGLLDADAARPGRDGTADPSGVDVAHERDRT